MRARNLIEPADRLDQQAMRKVAFAPTSKQIPWLGFVLNRQGAQRYAMGRELLRANPVFANAVDKVDAVLRKLYGAGRSFKVELLSDAKSSRVSDIRLNHPVTVAL